MTHQITTRIIKIIAMQLGEQPADIEMGKHLIANLGCDSLDIVEIMMHLENEFGIDIDEDAFEKLSTVQELIAHVAALITQQRPEQRYFANDTQRQVHQLKNTLEAHFAIAKRVQIAAAGLDWIKHHPDTAKAIEAQQLIADLHACVATLAGDRAGELYASEEDMDEARALAAGTACCASDVCAGPGWAAVEGALA